MIKDFLRRNNKFIATLSSLVVGFVLASLILQIMNINPFDLLTNLLKGAFVNKEATFQTLQVWTLYIFLGISVAIGFRIGIFNIGVSGQMIFAMSMAYMYVFKHSSSNTGILIFVSFLITIAAAAAYAMIAAMLKAYFGVHEVVTTIMLNWIAIKLVNYLLETGHVKQGAFREMTNLPKGVNTHIESISPYFSWMFFIALAVVGVMFIIFKFTKIGQKITITGNNPNASTYSGFSDKALILLTFGFSGVIAGLAAFTYFFGVYGKLGATMNVSDLQSPISIGFLGISIALIGMNSSIGILLSAFMFALLNNPVGVNTVQTTMGINSNIIDLYSSVIIYFVAIVNIFIYYINPTQIKLHWNRMKYNIKNRERKEVKNG